MVETELVLLCLLLSSEEHAVILSFIYSFYSPSYLTNTLPTAWHLEGNKIDKVSALMEPDNFARYLTNITSLNFYLKGVTIQKPVSSLAEFGAQQLSKFSYTSQPFL